MRARAQAHVNRCPQLIFICVERWAIIKLVDLWLEHPLNNGKKWIPRWWHTCVQGEKLPTRTLSLPWEAFPFLDLRSEGLSNLASLDQTSFLLLYDRGKWKFFPRHEKFVLICILSLDTCMSPWRNYYSLLDRLHRKYFGAHLPVHSVEIRFNKRNKAYIKEQWLLHNWNLAWMQFCKVDP